MVVFLIKTALPGNAAFDPVVMYPEIEGVFWAFAQHESAVKNKRSPERKDLRECILADMFISLVAHHLISRRSCKKIFQIF